MVNTRIRHISQKIRKIIFTWYKTGIHNIFIWYFIYYFSFPVFLHTSLSLKRRKGGIKVVHWRICKEETEKNDMKSNIHPKGKNTFSISNREWGVIYCHFTYPCLSASLGWSSKIGKRQSKNNKGVGLDYHAQKKEGNHSLEFEQLSDYWSRDAFFQITF